jgi:hypothetical protein
LGDLLRDGFGGAFGTAAPAVLDVSAKAFSLLGGHLLETMLGSALPAASPATVTVKAAEEDLAEKKEAEGLHEGDGPDPEDVGEEPVPEVFDHVAEGGDGDGGEDNNLEDLR